MACLGLGGWAVLLAATFSPSFGPDSVARPDWLSFAMFLVVIVAARAMAVRLHEDAVISLDAAFYIAAAVCLGSVVSGRLVAVALLVDAIFRLALTRDDAPRPWVAALVYGLYFGGMSGALLMGVAWLFRLDELYVLAGVGDVTVLARVVVVGLVFICSHYALQGIRLYLMSESLGSYILRVAGPGVVAEATLLPLAAVVVFIYHPDQPLKFALLGTTYLIMNFAFNRLSSTSSQLRLRVRELETLNATSRRLAASLQVHDLVRSVALETMGAIGEAENFTLVHRRDEGLKSDTLIVEIYDRETEKFDRSKRIDHRGVSGLVMAEQRSIYIPDLRETELECLAFGGARSWLGVPMIIYGEVEGVVAVQSRDSYAFTPEHLRLLEAIGAQAAVALQNARLYELAMVDGLTRLFVRRYFDARLDEEIQRSHRFETDFSVVMMDVDNFKKLNDTYGHPTGDRVLRDLARIVREEMRGVDTAARYGGEEIALILPRTGMVDAYNVAERIRSKIEAHRITSDDGEELQVTASFGISSHPESQARSSEELVRLADQALYRAKRTGKNRVEL